MEIHEHVLWSVSRRDILRLSASVLSALFLGGMTDARIGHAADMKFPEDRCGGAMKKRVLVTYASKYGSTGGIADAIGKELCANGVNADVVLIKHARDVSAYHGVVVGSAVYMGKWMPEAADFVKENREILRRMPVAYFLACISLSQPTEKNRTEALAYLDPLLTAVPEIKPVGIGTFAGALDYRNLSWPMRMIMKSKGTPKGDFRDWNAIRAWAREPLSGKLIRSELKK